MLKAMEKLYSHVKNCHSFQVLPGRVKNKLNISSELFKKEGINFVVCYQGNLSYKDFDYVYCSICQNNIVPMLLEQYKEKQPDNPKINDLINNWDTLDVPTNFLDLAGCIIPDKEDISSAAHGLGFIKHSTEHSAFYVKPSCSKG